VHGVADTEDGECDLMNDFILQTSSGDDIKDVSSLKTALKRGNVVIRVQ